MNTELSTYEIQANAFLEKTQTKFESVFKTFDSMPFDKDGTKRNIFTITLSNAKHKYSFEFGSSLADSCKPTPKIKSNEEVEINCGIRHGGDIGIFFDYKIKTTYKILRDSKNDALFDRKQFNEEFTKYQDQIKAYNAKLKRAYLGGFIVGCGNRELEDRIFQRITDARAKAWTETTLLDQADEIKQPTAYDVLACLTKSDPGTFENFCR